MKQTSFLVSALAGALLSVVDAGYAQSNGTNAESAPSSQSPERETMIPAIKAATLKVSGARIYYEMQGSGPLLVLIPGGPADAGAFTELARRLAHRYTVVAYDPRGNSRSTFDGAPEEQRLDVHGDDAARLIEALGGAAYVFGTSGGAQIGLNLAARHPQRVRALVAHEPPCVLLLDDPSKVLANNREISDTYHREGPGAAIQKFMAMNGMTGGPGLQSAAAMETFARIQKNFDYFLAHGLGPLASYRPDVDALRTGRIRVVVGVGEATTGQTANRTALALASKLGTRAIVFPGDHIGYGPHADTFAEILQWALHGEATLTSSAIGAP